MEPITMALLGGGALLGLWALTSKKPAGAPGSEEVQALADTVSTVGPKGERRFMPEAARNLLVSLASATASNTDPSNPFMVEYAPIPSGAAVPPGKSAFGWVSEENKSRSVLAPLYAVTTAASKQRKFLRSVAPGTEAELAGPNGIYAVLVYAGALARKETPPGNPGGVVPAPGAPPTQPAATVPGGQPMPGPAPSGGGQVATVIAPSGANIRSSPNGAKIGALNKGSSVSVVADAGSVGGHIWKQITVLKATPGSNGQTAPGTSAFVAAELLSTGAAPAPGGAAVPGGGGAATAILPQGAPAPAGGTATVIAPSGANVRSSANGVKTGALAKGSTVKVISDAGSAGGHQWKQIQVVNPTAGSSGAPAGSSGYIAAELLSGTGAAPGGVASAIAQAAKTALAVEQTPPGNKLWVNISSTPLLSQPNTLLGSEVGRAARNDALTVIDKPSLLSPKWVKVTHDKSGATGYVSVLNVTANKPVGIAGYYARLRRPYWRY